MGMERVRLVQMEFVKKVSWYNGLLVTIDVRADNFFEYNR